MLYFFKRNTGLEQKCGAYMARSVLVMCFLCLAVSPVYAARQATPAQWQQVTQDKAFTYKNDIEAVQPVVDDKPGVMQKLFMALFKFFGSGAGNILLLIIVAGVVVYIVWRLFFSGDSFLFGRSKKIMGEATAEQTDEEDLANTNWEALLQQAIANNDARLAVRYSYKWLLQLLQQKELIQYRNDKTNYEYYTELNDSAYKQSFKQLSRQYEYAWYGQFVLSAAAYNEYLTLFNSVRKQLGA